MRFFFWFLHNPIIFIFLEPLNYLSDFFFLKNNDFLALWNGSNANYLASSVLPIISSSGYEEDRSLLWHFLNFFTGSLSQASHHPVLEFDFLLTHTKSLIFAWLIFIPYLFFIAKSIIPRIFWLVIIRRLILPSYHNHTF